MMVGGLMFGTIAIAALAFTADDQIGEAVPIVRAPKAHVAIFSDVRMEHDGSYLRVPAELGAVRSDLILDTAASSMVVSPAVVGALGITDKGQADVLGAGGSSQYEAVGIPLLRVGDIERRGVGAVVADLSRFRRNPARPYGGILGNDFLRSFDVEINVPGRRLRLYQPQPSARIHGFQEAHAVANLSSDDGWIVLEVLVNGQPIRAIVDTAAPTSVMNWAAARRAGVTPQTPGLRRREQPTGGLGPGAAETHLFSFKDVRAGRTRFNPSELRIADLRVFEALGLRDQPAMLFGLDMLQETPMLVSYSSRKIFFKPPPF
jgi:predicted aspartyl protease